jgi:hypothetical protein
MESLEKYLLKSDAESDDLRRSLGEKFDPFYSAVIRLLDTIPKNTWYDFTASIHPSNYETFIKLVCHRYNTCRTINDYVELNNTCTKIRRVLHSEPQSPPMSQKSRKP